MNKLVYRPMILGSICFGALVSLGSIANTAKAQTQPNCPRIFYREPFTNQVAAPEGCPPTEFQQRRQPFGSTTVNRTDPTITSESNGNPPPLPEQRGDAIATVPLVNDQIEVVMTNNTGAPVTYEVIGDTRRRMLMAGEMAMLQTLRPPLTITAVRQDGGLLDIVSVSSEDGKLELSLRSEPGLDDTQGVIRIQADGQVFVN